jgi:hypothetical protein
VQAALHHQLDQHTGGAAAAAAAAPALLRAGRRRVKGGVDLTAHAALLLPPLYQALVAKQVFVLCSLVFPRAARRPRRPRAALTRAARRQAPLALRRCALRALAELPALLSTDGHDGTIAWLAETLVRCHALGSAPARSRTKPHEATRSRARMREACASAGRARAKSPRPEAAGGGLVHVTAVSVT